MEKRTLNKGSLITPTVKQAALKIFVLYLLAGFPSFDAWAQTQTQTVVPTIRIDNNYDDWQNVQPVATFSINFSPVYFQQEKAGKVNTLDIEDAQYWKRAGTLLKTIKAQEKDRILYLHMESHSNFAEFFSVFLYLFKERKKEQANTYTLELVPLTAKKGEGLVLLWKKGETKPRQCGRLLSNAFQMELSLPIKDLPKEIQSAYAQLSFDVTTCYQDKETKTETETAVPVYEDYFFTTIYTKDIR